ncbi:hypothetical protein DMC47_42955 [Nostoc sp. 3335mG]|nr:hypothetical protein DMC47_42955 [Nostoc sp. 3335mG]
MPGEGGETTPATVSTGGTDTSYDYDLGGDYDYDMYSSQQGTTSGTNTLNLEVALMSIEAADRVAEAIAARVAAALKGAGIAAIAIANPDLIAALRLRGALDTELSALEATVAAAPARPLPDDVTTAAFGAPAAAIAMQSVKRAAQSASAALTVFGVTTRYSGRKDTVRPATLDAAIAKHIATHGIGCAAPLHAVPKARTDGLLARALTLQQACRRAGAAGTAGPEIEAAGQVVDALVSAMFDVAPSAGGGQIDIAARLPQQLMLADAIADAADNGAAILSLDLAAAGGNYRARRWLLNFLIGADGLSFNGGAAVTFFLLAPDRSTVLASDTLYSATGYSRFPAATSRFSGTNIRTGD